MSAPYTPLSVLEAFGPPTTFWTFIGLDLSASEALESGLVILDRDKQPLRLDKLFTTTELLASIEALGTPEQTLIALDLPRALNVPGRWRQEAFKMTPLLSGKAFQASDTPHEAKSNTEARMSKRGRTLLEALQQKGYRVFYTLNSLAKLHYGLHSPFRSRTSQANKALQAALKEWLGINTPSQNMLANTVQEALLAAYVAWSIHQGQEGLHYACFLDDGGHVFVDPLMPVALKEKRPIRRRFRR